MRFLYTALFYLSLPVILLRIFLRSRRLPGYRERISERFGFSPHQLSECIWLHAVSVGETIAAIPLIKSLKQTYPTVPLLVTNMTPTGAARLKAIFGDTVLHTYVPYDLPSAWQRFFNRIHPKCVIIMETELWPNLFAVCRKQHIPLIVTNARLSQKSAEGYKKINKLTHEMFLALHQLAAQSKADADRFKQLGLPENKIKITGNLKFDLEVPADLSVKAHTLRKELGVDRFILIAASTHPTEEEIILQAFSQIQSKEPRALLILVPRHPDRFETVATLCKGQSFKIARRSQKEIGSSAIDIYLGDTMGELLLLYAVCDVAFVAGSFAQIGGHNMLEAAALHKPILSGPVLFNFIEVSQLLLNAGGMKVVQNANELSHMVLQLFADPKERIAMGENAFKIVEANRGALQKQMQVIQSVMPEF